MYGIGNLSKAELDELLTPRLTADDDALAFARPWAPQHLLVWTFFAGLYGGGFLFCQNFRRLGMQDRVWKWAIVFLVAQVLSLFLALCATVYMVSKEMELDRAQSLTSTGLRVFSLGIGFLALRAQKRRFRLFGVRDEEAGPLIAWGIGALLGGWALLAGTTKLLAPLAIEFMTKLGVIA